MTLPPFPTTTRDQINEMIQMDGREVSFYVIDTISGCWLCSLDPITNTSTDSYCPVCSGEYWLETFSGWDVTAHVTWGKSESKSWETGGMLDNGDCTVKFIYSGGYEEIVHSSQFVIVDHREMDVDKIILRGVPEINRIIVSLKEKERQ
jgi:hypothetical protein